MISHQRALAPYAGVVGAIATVGFAIDVPYLWIPLLAFGFAAFVMVETQQRGSVAYHKGWWQRSTAFAMLGALVVLILWREGSSERLIHVEAVLVLGMFWAAMPRRIFGQWAKYYGFALLLTAVAAGFLPQLRAGYYALVVGLGSLAYALALRITPSA